MAEGWARSVAGHSLDLIASAGIEAHGLNPRAVQVMLEAGVDISGQASNQIHDFNLEEFQLVVTVCGDADEHCPLLPPGVEKRHWPLSDPAKLTGTEEEILAGFRRSRDDIRFRVESLIAELT